MSVPPDDDTDRAFNAAFAMVEVPEGAEERAAATDRELEEAERMRMVRWC